MSDILHSLREFLHEHYRPGRPILLGYSGGPDSSALLHAFWQLKGCFRTLTTDLVVIHIDHSWREESAEEAEALKKNIEILGLSCIFERLEKGNSDRNLEEKARLDRLNLFQKHYQFLGAQALILAHQAGDQAETVVKRLFEGSCLTALGAMQRVSLLEGMVVWRPMLKISKSDLLEYCLANEISYLVDRTNVDVRFLRARMRKDLLPMLEKIFGKCIEMNLTRFAQNCDEINSYFETKVQSLLDQIIVQENEVFIDFNGVHPIEAKFVIKKITSDLGICLGQQHLDQLACLLQKKGGQRLFSIGKAIFYITHSQLKIVFKNLKTEKNISCSLNKNEIIDKNKRELLLNK